MYVENELNKSWKWILGIASALLLLPQLAMPELTSSEALYGLMARNANISGDLFSTAPQGLEVNHGHLYPWLVNFLGIFGVNEFTIRLPSILGLAIMIILSSYLTYKYGGRQSAIVAGICMLSSFAAVKMGTRGEENMFGGAFLSAAWLIWFQMSRDKKNWFKAWLYSLLLVSISAFSLGYYVFILFYIPLVFLRKPTDVRKRMLLLPHYQALGIIICIHTVIFLIVSNLDSTLGPALGISIGQTDHYTNDLFNFPFTAAVFLLPWTFFSWTPFCAAFDAMEKDHVLFHFLRTVVFSLFITFWIIPDSTPLSLLPVLPALAIMTGLHYQILVRRYHIYIRKLVRFILGVLAAANIALIIIFSLKLVGLGSNFIKEITLNDQWIRINIIICGASVLLAAFLLLRGREYPVWIKIMCMVVVGHWCIISFNNIKDRDKISDKKVGSALSEQIPELATVYNLKKRPHDTVMFYLGNVRVHHLGATLEENDKRIPETLYVISGVKPPVSITSNPAHYNWMPLSEKLKRGKEYFQAWKGTLKELPAFNP